MRVKNIYCVGNFTMLELICACTITSKTGKVQKNNLYMTRTKPLSPHLSIYKPQVTSIFSIIHRVTGAYMFFFITLWTFALFLLEPSLENSKNANWDCRFLQNTFIVTMAFFIIALSYHLCNGIRYLFWTCNIGMDMTSVKFSAWVVLLSTVVMSTASIILFLI